MRGTTDERFWAKVDKHGPIPPHAPHLGPCWLWTASTTSKGYGQFFVGGGRSTVGAHRYSYESVHGAPIGRDVDHRCHVPACVNPDHLRACTRKQNHENRRGAMVTNPTGIRGVSWHKASRKWQARVVHHDRYYSKLCPDVASAESWVIAKRCELFTHNDLDRRAS